MQKIINQIEDPELREEITRAYGDLREKYKNIKQRIIQIENRLFEKSLRLDLEKRRVSNWTKVSIIGTVLGVIISVVFIWIRVDETKGSGYQKLRVEKEVLVRQLANERAKNKKLEAEVRSLYKKCKGREKKIERKYKVGLHGKSQGKSEGIF